MMRSLRWVFSCLLMLFALNSLAATISITDSGNPDLDEKTDPTWQKLSEAFNLEIRSAPNRLSDSISEAYLESLAKQLQQQTIRDQTHLYLINSPSINAFAGPGNIIVVHTGLFEAAEDENELAAVLAHELSHQHQHHLWRRMQHEKDLRGPIAVGTLVAIALGALNPAIGQSALSAGATLVQQNELKYSRVFEQEADRMGIDMLSRSGFDTRSMAAFFSKLSQNERYTMNRSVPEILRTHPLTDARIADSINHASLTPHHHPASSLDFLLVKERLHVLSTPYQQTEIERYQTLKNLRLPQHYGYALALLGTQKQGAAITELETLCSQYKDNLVLNLTLASAYEESREDNKALTLLKKLSLAHPNNATITVAYAKSLFDKGDYSMMIPLLEKAASSNDNSKIEDLMAQAYGRKKQLDQAYFHQARAMQLLAYRRQAKQYYKKSKSISHDTKLMAQIDHWLRVM